MQQQQQQQTQGGGSGEAAKRAASCKQQRRLSSQPAASETTASKEDRQPMLTAFLSEDPISSHQHQPQARQSFLSKLTRPPPPPQQQSTRSCGGGGESPLARLDGTECDKIDPAASAPPRKNDLDQKQATKAARDSGHKLRQQDDDHFHQQYNYDNNNNNNDHSKHDHQRQDKQQEDRTTNSSNQKREQDNFEFRTSDKVEATTKAEEIEEDEDDDNQVIPSWPSKSDAHFQGRSHEFIQHKVYSLKDYSQVASPTATTSSMAAAQALHEQQQLASSLLATRQHQLPTTQLVSGKLLKSLSQERKIKANAKRMSECLHQPQPAAGHKQSPPSGPVGASSSGSFSLGASDSLQAGSSGRQSSVAGASLLGESRIDRMRKLFVSPLSLRSSAGSGCGSGHLSAASGTSNKSSSSSMAASANPRLSLQAGSAMLNKKPTNQLMHAVYRGGGHHNRRSPMRQSKGKSFRVYGCPLQLANNIYPITCFGRADIYKQQSVPYVLARLCNYIEENSSQLTHEGIFRVSGNARLMEKLRTLFDHLGDAPLESESVDVATSASMLKMYLRELPEPLIPTRMNYYFIALAKKYSPILAKETIQGGGGGGFGSSQVLTWAAGGGSGQTGAMTAASEQQHEGQALSERQRLAFARDLTKLVRKLPIENYNLLKYLACFLYRVSLKQQYNKMCAEALGIVFGPNVFRIRSESYKGLKEQELSNQVMASIIRNYKSIFDSELTDPLGNPVVCSSDDANNKLITAAAGAALVGAAASATGASITVTPTTFEPTKKAAISSATPTEADQIGANLIDDSSQIGEIESTPEQQLTDKVVSNVLAAAAAIATKAEAAAGGVQLPACSTAPSASASTSASAKLDLNLVAERPICCPEHCPDYLFGEDEDEIDDEEDVEGRVSEPDDENEEEEEDDEEDALDESEEDYIEGEEEDDDDDDDDDDCDEGESYTPSSGSGSYCSSMDSETLESSYDEPGHERNADLASRSNMSSSECGSDTSYTPTSSHTDSEPHDVDASFYGNSSSFESSPSFAHRRQTSQRTKRRASTSQHEHQQQQSSCLVCKRRQSSVAQVSEAAGILSAEAAAATCDSETVTEAAVASGSKSNDNETNRTRAAGNEFSQPSNEKEPPWSSDNRTTTAIPLVELATSDISDTNQASSGAGAGDAAHKSKHEQQLCLPPRASARKKRLDSSGGGAGGSTRRQQQQQHLPTTTCGDEQQQAASGSRSSRHPSGRSTSRLEFMRRRSSSASSLSRVKHKQEQLAAALAAQKKSSSSSKAATASNDETHAAKTQRAAVLVGSGANFGPSSRLHAVAARGSTSRQRSKGKSSSSSSATHHHHHLTGTRRTPGAEQQQFASELFAVADTTTARGSSSSSRQPRARTIHTRLGSHVASRKSPRVSGARTQQSKDETLKSGDRLPKAVTGDDGEAFASQTHTADRILLTEVEAACLELGIHARDSSELEGAEELAASCWGALSAQCLEEELDYEDKYFLLRPYNSDETLLHSSNYYSSEFSDLPPQPASTANTMGNSGSHNNDGHSSQKSMTQNRAPRWPRRFSGHDLDDKLMASAVYQRQQQQQRPCDQILLESQLEFGGGDNQEEGESTNRANAEDLHEDARSHFAATTEQQPLAGSDLDCSQSASPCTLLGANASFVSLLDNRLDNLNFRVDSELSLHQQTTGSELPGATTGGDYLADDLPTADPILAQMRSTKELLRALRKLSRILNSSSSFARGVTLEPIVLRLTSEPNPGEQGLSYSDDFSVCSVDQLAAKSLVEQLEQSLLASDQEERQAAGATDSSCSEIDHHISSGKTERLAKLLGAKIVAFKQRYTDLKGIRQHYLKSHSQRATEGGTDSSLAANVSPGSSSSPAPTTTTEVEGRSAKSEPPLHGSLKSLRPNDGGQRQEEGGGQQADKSKSQEADSSAETQMSLSPHESRERRKLSEPSCKESPPANVIAVRSSGAPQTSATEEQQTATAIQVPRRQSTGRSSCEGAAATSCLQTTATAASGQEASSGDYQLAAAVAASGCRQISTRCKFGSLCPVEFVFNIEKQLATKRATGSRLIKLNEMNVDQLQDEKLDLQKNLLRYEHWFGRPTTRLDFSLVGHLYERYRAVKMIKSRKQQQQKEEEH